MFAGLDPARPLVDQFGDAAFRLTRDDAKVVQVIHTNAGALGEEAQVGHVDFCVNGGRMQPGCRGHRLSESQPYSDDGNGYSIVYVREGKQKVLEVIVAKERKSSSNVSERKNSVRLQENKKIRIRAGALDSY